MDLKLTDWDRFLRHFPLGSKDVALVVLKAHLLLEESVMRMLASLLLQPEAIERANLRFYQKLCLIKALLPVDPYMMEAAEKLNTMRNKLAHHLDYPQIEAQVRDFLSLCEAPKDPDEPDDPETEAEPIILRLERALTYLCGRFAGMSRALEDRAAAP
jgi:hypothetical protein